MVFIQDHSYDVSPLFKQFTYRRITDADEITGRFIRNFESGDGAHRDFFFYQSCCFQTQYLRSAYSSAGPSEHLIFSLNAAIVPIVLACSAQRRQCSVQKFSRRTHIGSRSLVTRRNWISSTWRCHSYKIVLLANVHLKHGDAWWTLNLTFNSNWAETASFMWLSVAGCFSA